LPLVVWQAPQVLQARDTGFYPYSLGEMTEILLNGWSLGISSLGSPWGTVLMGVLAVWGLVSPLSPPPTPPLPPKVGEKGRGAGEGLGGRLALVCWLVTPLLAVWLISQRQPLFTDRYFIWAAPAFYLLVALGLVSLRRFGNWGRWASSRALSRAAIVFLTSIILVFNGVNLWQQATVPIKSDFRAAATYIADHRSPGELIIFQIPHSRYTFDYYFPGNENEDVEKYLWADGLYTNHRAPDGSYLMGEQEAAHCMREMTAGYSTVWLVVTEMTMWDERGLVQAWLEANGERANEGHFMRVDVYRYAK
jgi:hypothetical protein